MIFIFGYGYTAKHLANKVSEKEIFATSRSLNSSQINQKNIQIIDPLKTINILEKYKNEITHLVISVPPDQSGDIFLNTKNIVSMSSKDRDTFRADHLGILFQMFNLVPFLSILRNVTLPCSFSAARRARAIEKIGSVEREARRILWQMGLDDK